MNIMMIIYTVFLLFVNIYGYLLSGFSLLFLWLLSISVLCYMFVLKRELKIKRYKNEDLEIRLEILNMFKK